MGSKGIPGSAERETLVQRRVGEITRNAKALMLLGHNHEAELLCLSAIEIRDKVPETWLVLAASLENQGKQQEAIDAYRYLIYPVNWGEM